MIFIAVYVISDIHGEYELFMKMLEKIKFQDTDTLYILGDILDRGPNPIRVLRKLMEMPNVIPIVGNHELMAVKCLDLLCEEITTETIKKLNNSFVENLLIWQENGGYSTIVELRRYNAQVKKELIEYIKEFLIYETLTVNRKKYLLVHAGLGNFSEQKDIEEYSLHDLVWGRVDYEKCYFEDMYVVSGHTPTQSIKGNPRLGFVYQKNHHIAIDCGACFPNGRLAAFCLDTGEEFYVER